MRLTGRSEKIVSVRKRYITFPISLGWAGDWEWFRWHEVEVGADRWEGRFYTWTFHIGKLKIYFGV